MTARPSNDGVFDTSIQPWFDDRDQVGFANRTFLNEPAWHRPVPGDTTVNAAGRYLVSYRVNVRVDNDAENTFALRVNGQIVPSSVLPLAGSEGVVSTTTLIDLAAGDTLALVYHSPNNEVLHISADESLFSLVRLR